jgi:hypothetical protein
VALACAFVSGAAAADSVSAPARLSQSVVAVGAPVLAKVNLHAKFSSVDGVCFDFTFTSDLLDPGEILLITPLQLWPSLSGPGFEDIGLTSQGERELCLESAFGYSSAIALFGDGKDKDLEIGMQTGSVQIASLVVTVTGTLR